MSDFVEVSPPSTDPYQKPSTIQQMVFERNSGHKTHHSEVNQVIPFSESAENPPKIASPSLNQNFILKHGFFLKVS